MKIYRIAQNNYNELDDLMIAGWGVANQLDQNNYVRKGWDVAFRIAKASTPEQRETAINVLRDAATKLIKELVSNTDPTIKRYVNELIEVLYRA